MLNSFFDAVFCINLDRRPDRLERFAQMAEHHKFTFTRWPAVDGKELKNGIGGLMEENDRRNMELACKLSHLRLIRHAKNEGYNRILIFEDDARLSENWLEKLKAAVKPYPYGLVAEYDVRAHGWHMLYLGVNHINPPIQINDNLVQVVTGFTTHSYAVNFPAYDLLIEALDYRGQADVLYADYIHPLGKSYAIYPNIAYQEDGFSDITLKEESYQQLK